MALANMGIKRPKLVSFGKKEKREEKKKDRRRGRRWRSQDQASQKGMELWIFVWKLTLVMNSMRFGMELWVCMMINLLKPRVLLGFHPNPKIMESKVDKTLNSTRRS